MEARRAGPRPSTRRHRRDLNHPYVLWSLGVGAKWIVSQLGITTINDDPPWTVNCLRPRVCVMPETPALRCFVPAPSWDADDDADIRLRLVYCAR